MWREVRRERSELIADGEWRMVRSESEPSGRRRTASREMFMIPNAQRSAIRHRFFFCLGVILHEAATEALLFGEMIGEVERCQVGNPFLGFFATV